MDNRLAMRAYRLAYAEWVVCRDKVGPPPEPPAFALDGVLPHF